MSTILPSPPPDATPTNRGLMSTGPQGFSGTKQFHDALYLTGSSTATPLMSLSNNTGGGHSTIEFRDQYANFAGKIGWSNNTGDPVYGLKFFIEAAGGVHFISSGVETLSVLSSGGIQLPDGTVIARASDLARAPSISDSQSWAPLGGIQAPEGITTSGAAPRGEFSSDWSQTSSFQNGEYHLDAGSTEPGAWVFNMVTGTNGTNAGGVLSGPAQQRPSSWPIARFVGKSSGTARRWVGLTNNWSTLMGGDSPTTVKAVAFRYTSGVDTTWKAVVGNGSGGTTVVDTGVTFVDAKFYRMEVRYVASGSVKFFIDDVLVATITNANVPTGSADTDRLTPIMMGRNMVAANYSQQVYSIHIGRGLR